MKNSPRIGTIGERQVTVEETHAIRFGEAGPAVLSTPWLVWFLEHAALDAALPALDEGEITVGIHVTVDHLAPTPVGARIVCRARVVHCEGPVISYQLEATDEQETIARGYHKRRVVSAGKLAKRVAQKITQASRGVQPPEG